MSRLPKRATASIRRRAGSTATHAPFEALGAACAVFAASACGFVAGIQELELVPDASTSNDSGSPPTDQLTPQDTGAGCEAGKMLCGGNCVDPTDPQNCGACGNVCTSGLCGTNIAEDMAAKPVLWDFNGNAVYNASAPSGMLTAAGGDGHAGTMVYAHPISTDSFEAKFDVRIGLNGGARADGMGFMIERAGSKALGANGKALAMAGLEGYAVEFDVFNNGSCGDANGNHIGIDSLIVCSGGMPTSLFATPDLAATVGDLADGKWRSVIVKLAGGSISVTVGGEVVATDVALPGFFAGTPYYFGFAGSTGYLVLPDGTPVGGLRHEVRAISITFPTPRCL